MLTLKGYSKYVLAFLLLKDQLYDVTNKEKGKITQRNKESLSFQGFSEPLKSLSLNEIFSINYEMMLIVATIRYIYGMPGTTP